VQPGAVRNPLPGQVPHAAGKVVVVEVVVVVVTAVPVAVVVVAAVEGV
jgi:hypothetical protein